MSKLKEYFDLYNINYDEAQLLSLTSYMNYILEKNNFINLTAIKDSNEFEMKMILDSALPISLCDFTNKKIIDVGTGAGFPGTVIATLTNANVDLLDSTKKKLDVISDFGFKNVNLINKRVEDYAKTHRETYDIAIARAVAPLNILLETILPLVKTNGYFIGMKSLGYEKEIEASKVALQKLDAQIVQIKEEELPNGDSRVNILIRKNKPTNKKYPRSYSDILSKPL